MYDTIPSVQRQTTPKAKIVNAKKEDSQKTVLCVLALPIFPVRLQTSIVGRIELNFRVRDGNGWTLDLINTNYIQDRTLKTEQERSNIQASLHNL